MQCLVLHSCKAVPGFVHLKRNTFTALKCTQRSTQATHAVGQATSGGSDAGNRATQQQEYVAAAIDTLAGIIDAKIEASRRVSPTTLILSMWLSRLCGARQFPKRLCRGKLLQAVQCQAKWRGMDCFPELLHMHAWGPRVASRIYGTILPFARWGMNQQAADQ
jgi:hypothetical protein